MPTYNYKCKNCDERTVIFQKISDLPLVKCEKCDGELKRIISGGTGLIFKGDGFYLTDYARKDKKSDSKKEKLKTDEKPKSKGKYE
jgi:putative FmdB family regulatory protein